MGLFEELDIASAKDNPWEIPNNTYRCLVTDVVVKKNQSDNMGMTFYYTIQDGEQKGLKVSEYKRMPHPTDAEPLDKADADKALSYIKMRLASLGIPEERMNSVEKDDLIGIECFVTTKQNGQYTNVNNVTLQDSAGVAASGPAGNMFT